MRALVFLFFVACTGTRATRKECERILERIVEIELAERGYADPLLTKLKQTTLVRKLSMEIDACIGRRLAPDAMRCIEEAKSVEALTHDCLSD